MLSPKEESIIAAGLILKMEYEIDYASLNPVRVGGFLFR